MFEHFYPMGMLDRDQRTTITLPKMSFADDEDCCTKFSMTKTLRELLFAYENCDKCVERSSGTWNSTSNTTNDTIPMDCSKNNINKFKQRVVKRIYIKSEYLNIGLC